MAAVAYGHVAIVPKGIWNADTQYEVCQLVEYDGSSYVAKAQPPVGTLPTDTSYWQVSAAGTKKASSGSLGTVMPDGSTTEVNEEGKLSAKTAQQNALGVVKGSDDITVGEDGNLTVNTTFEQATEIANIIAGEAIKSVLGKVSKAIATTMSLDENALLKNMISGIDVNDGNKVPSSAYIHSLVERIGMGTALEGGFDNLTAGLNSVNNNLSKKLSVGDNIASADLLNDNPAERFGTLSMRFSDGTINQLLLLKDTAAVTILRNNVWQEQYRLATTSMLSDYISKSGIKFVEQYLKSTQTLSPSGTTLLNDASITIPFNCIAILTWKLHCKSSEQKTWFYYMVNNAYVQGEHQWDGTIQTDETVNIFIMNRFSKDQELTVSVKGNCSVVGNNTSLTRYCFAFIPV